MLKYNVVNHLANLQQSDYNCSITLLKAIVNVQLYPHKLFCKIHRNAQYND